MLVAFDVLRYFTAPVEADSSAFSVLYCESYIAADSPALTAKAYGCVPSWSDGGRLRELCVQVLEGDAAADCKPVGHFICYARVYIDSYEVAIQCLVAPNPVVLIICFKPVGGSDRKRSEKVLGKLVHEVKVWNVRSDACVAAVRAGYLLAHCVSFPAKRK